MLWEDKPLWQWQAAKLAQLEPAELMIAGRADQAFEGEGFKVVPDRADESGPLPSLIRCLEVAQKPVLLLGVDLPLMTQEVLAFVLNHSRAQRGFVFERDGFYEPMAAFYPLAMLDHLNAARAQGRMQEAIRSGVKAGVLDSAPLPQAFARAFINANTPDEWKHAQQSR